MKGQGTKKYRPGVYEEACEWFVEFRSGVTSESTRKDFCAWLQQAPAHMAAYLDVAASWGQSGTFDVTAHFPKSALIAEAIRDDDKVLAHPATAGTLAAQPRRDSPRSAWKRVGPLLIAAGMATVAVATGWVTWFYRYPTYSTGIGEERLIELDDGSTLDLNASSRVRVHFTDRERDVALIAGQALFSVAKNPSRPFIVHTGSTLVRAVGTEFDVNRRARETIVTVVEGVVAVADARMRTPTTDIPLPPGLAAPWLSPVYVTAGEQLSVGSSKEQQPVHVDVAHAIAWTSRQLVFASTPLKTVVEEFNQHSRRKLVIADPALDAFEIDGVFSSADSTALLDFLRQRPDIRVTETDNEVLISSK